MTTAHLADSAAWKLMIALPRMAPHEHIYLFRLTDLISDQLSYCQVLKYSALRSYFSDN